VSTGFLEVSGGGGAIFFMVSFFAVSTAFAAESAVEVDLFPEQEAKETAKAKARAPNLIELFIFDWFNCD